MDIERKTEFISPDYNDNRERETMDYIYPLEEVVMGRRTDFQYVRVPTEQGKLLLEFLRRHAFGSNDYE